MWNFIFVEIKSRWTICVCKNSFQGDAMDWDSDRSLFQRTSSSCSRDESLMMDFVKKKKRKFHSTCLTEKGMDQLLETLLPSVSVRDLRGDDSSAADWGLSTVRGMATLASIKSCRRRWHGRSVCLQKSAYLGRWHKYLSSLPWGSESTATVSNNTKAAIFTRSLSAKTSLDPASWRLSSHLSGHRRASSQFLFIRSWTLVWAFIACSLCSWSWRAPDNVWASLPVKVFIFHPSFAISVQLASHILEPCFFERFLPRTSSCLGNTLAKEFNVLTPSSPLSRVTLKTKVSSFTSTLLLSSVDMLST